MDWLKAFDLSEFFVIIHKSQKKNCSLSLNINGIKFLLIIVIN